MEKLSPDAAHLVQYLGRFTGAQFGSDFVQHSTLQGLESTCLGANRRTAARLAAERSCFHFSVLRTIPRLLRNNLGVPRSIEDIVLIIKGYRNSQTVYFV